jgi:hypothetical protein
VGALRLDYKVIPLIHLCVRTVLRTAMVISDSLHLPTPKHSPDAVTDDAVVTKTKILRVIFFKLFYLNRCTQYLKSRLE